MKLKRYASGSLPSVEQHSIEMHLENCALCSDAVHGLMLIPVYGEMDELSWKDRATTDLTGRLVRGVLLGGVLLAGIWVAWQFGRTCDNDGIAEVATTQQSRAIPPVPMTEAQEEMLIEEIVAAEELPAHELIGTTTETSDDQIEEPRLEERMEEAPVVPEVIDTMEPKRVTVERTIGDRKPKGIATRRPSRQLIYLHDMKIVDPKELYPRGGLMHVKTHSIAADRENPFDVREGLATHQQEIPYLQIMDNALGDISRKGYKTALWELVVLLEAHPNDVNGLFYAGLCYYNLGLFKRAQEAFKTSKQHSIDTFNEPAAWYYALCVERIDGHGAATIYFERIANENGFYSKKAAARIKAPVP